MSNKNEGKWLPYNLDGRTHDCKSSEGKSMEAKIMTLSAIRIERKKPCTIEERLARLEETVFGDAE